MSLPLPMRVAAGWWACSALATLLLPPSAQLLALADAAGATSGKVRYTSNARDGDATSGTCEKGHHLCHTDGAPRPLFTASALIEIRAAEMDQAVRATEILHVLYA